MVAVADEQDFDGGSPLDVPALHHEVDIPSEGDGRGSRGGLRACFGMHLRVRRRRTAGNEDREKQQTTNAHGDDGRSATMKGG